MRIKVCRFVNPDLALVTDFANSMRRRLIDAKGADIDPFGRMPLDKTIGPPEGFDKDVKAEPNSMYILIEGWIRNRASGYSLEPRVIYQDTEGKQYVLQGAQHPPAAFSKETLEHAAGLVVDWGIQTAKEYAAK
jgi:hypothetical protein